jgi:Ca-activated chloride channel family protein
MSSRIPAIPSTTAFGLVAWLEATRIALPLKGVECRFDVTAGVASVEIDQIFHQSHAQPLDCTYTFPLPAGAAVYRCVMQVNGREVSARIEAREEAQRIYLEQKAAGRRAALVETERENLFTLTLGNVQPGDVIVVQLAYFQTLERAASVLSLRVPVCPGVRYIPGVPLLRALSGRGTADDTDQVPDASRLSPPRIDALHPDAAYFSVTGKIARSDAAEGTLSSPTHPCLVQEGAERIDVALADRGAVPDRDLVLRWEEPRDAAFTPRAWCAMHGGEHYALVQLRAPAGVPVAEESRRDYYFLVDRSGSMGGEKWEKACEALRAFVGLLGAEDRVWITLFESDYRDFAEKPLTAPALLRDPGFQQLEGLGVDGGTELRPAAMHVLSKVRRHSPKGEATVIVITDGQVGNEGDVLRYFRGATDATVHTFGIDTTVNDALLGSLARQHGGDCWLLTPDDDIAGAIAGLGARLRRPVVTQLAVERGWELAGAARRALHDGQVQELSLRATAATPGAIRIAGTLANGEAHTFRIDPARSANPALRLLWARERIALLQAQGRQRKALALAKEHNLLCKGAAFVAWDEAEQVQVAVRQVYQPSLQSFGISDQPVYHSQCHILRCESGMRHRLLERPDAYPDVAEAKAPWPSIDPPKPTELELVVTHCRLRLLHSHLPDDLVKILAAWLYKQAGSFEAVADRIDAFVMDLEAAAAEAKARGGDVLLARLEFCRRFLVAQDALPELLDPVQREIDARAAHLRAAVL